MNSRERILTALNLGIPDRIPIFENSIAPNVIEDIIGEDDLLRFVDEIGLDGIAVTINYKKLKRARINILMNLTYYEKLERLMICN